MRGACAAILDKGFLRPETAAQLKQLAARQGITAMETKGDKLLLTRRQDYIMPGGKFPRLTRKTAQARLKEIRRFLLAL